MKIKRIIVEIFLKIVFVKIKKTIKLKKNKECGNIYNKIKVEKGVGKEKIVNTF